MESQYPRVVIWSEEAAHHYTLLVDRETGMAIWSCLDCGDGGAFPVDWLEDFKSWLNKETGWQMLMWVERNG